MNGNFGSSARQEFYFDVRNWWQIPAFSSLWYEKRRSVVSRWVWCQLTVRILLARKVTFQTPLSISARIVEVCLKCADVKNIRQIF